MTAAQGRAGSSLLDRLRAGMNFSFGGGGTAIGLSLGASSIKIAQLKKKKNGWTLIKYASVPITDIPGNHREISNPSSIVNSIQDVLKLSGVTGREVCSAIAGSGLIIKNLSIAITDMKELQDQVFWEAEQYIPYDITEVVVDFQMVGQPKNNQVDVILVAVKKDFLEQYLTVIEQAKLQPTIIDTELFALQNTFEANYTFSSTEAALLADVGALSTKIMICANGIPYFTKDAPFGGIMVTQEIQKEFNLPREQDAETLKVSNNLPQEVREILNRTGQNLAVEIKKAVDFYTASSLGPPLTKIFLSGGGSRIEGLPKIVSEYNSFDCEYLNPFQQVNIDSKAFTIDPATHTQEVVIPMGLAIRAGAGK